MRVFISNKGSERLLRSLILGVLVLVVIGFMPIIFPHLQNNSADAAAMQTNVQEESCRCCHGEHLPDRHHLLAANQCLDCHEMVWTPEISAYEFAPFRDCRLCHQYESGLTQYGTPDRHHLLVPDNGYGCLDCHPSRWDDASQSGYIGMLNDCDIPLYGNIEGQVTDMSGNPLQGAMITIPDHVKFSALSDADGFYLLQDVYTRDYSSIRAQLNGYATTDSMPVTVLDGQTLVVDLVMRPVGHITGTVTAIEGNMLEGVNITKGDALYSARADTGGSTTLQDGIVGDHTVRAESYDNETETKPVTVSQDSEMQQVNLVTTQHPDPEVFDAGIDNDMDGKTDCRDSRDCRKYPAWRRSLKEKRAKRRKRSPIKRNLVKR